VTDTLTDIDEFNRRNIEEFRANRGRIGGQFEGAPMLLLHSTGARSGEERVTPVMYLKEHDRYTIFASAAGADHHPAWYWNLVANPVASIEVDDQHLEVRAAEIQGPARDERYAEQARRYPGFAEYQEKTSRTIPIFGLFLTGRNADEPR
jgi:deazaflavin-dependent oxidoreductase (nitroreductase family)